MSTFTIFILAYIVLQTMTWCNHFNSIKISSNVISLFWIAEMSIQKKRYFVNYGILVNSAFSVRAIINFDIIY